MQPQHTAITQIKELIADLPPSMPKSMIASALQEYTHTPANSKVLIHLCIDKDLIKAHQELIQNALTDNFSNESFDFIRITQASDKSTKLGEPVATVLLAFFESDHNISQLFLESKKHYKIVDLATIQVPTQNLAKIVHLADDAAMQLYIKNLGENLSTERENILRTQQENILRCFAESAEDIVQRERKAGVAKKQFIAQGIASQRKQEGPTNMDLATQVRQVVTRRFMDFDRNLRAKYDKYNKPNVGKYSMEIAGDVTQLTSLESFYLAEKSEKIGAKISDEFLTNNIAKYAAILQQDYEQDQADANQLLSATTKDVNALLEKSGLQALYYNDMPRFPAKDKSIEPYLTMNKVYSGELIKKGVAEYFIALRDYTGLMMVVVGIVAPLNMIAAISENVVLKKMSIGIRIGTGLLTLLMVVYGVYDLRKRIPKRRVEDYEREMLKARDFFTSESKKMFSDSSRDWLTQLTAYIKDVQTMVGTQIEAHLKSSTAKSVAQSNEEKLQAAKRQQGSDNNLRTLDNALRAIENIKRSLQTTR